MTTIKNNMSLHSLAFLTLAKLSVDGGYTAWFSRDAAPSEGYLVDDGEHELVIPLESVDLAIPDNAAIVYGAIVDYLTDNIERLEYARDREFGAWLDTDSKRLYLDLSEYIFDKDRAIELGIKRNELSIYDIAACDIIDLNPEGEF